VAATNRVLADEVPRAASARIFFYRFAAAVISLPVLGEREGDAGLLLDRLLDQVNRESEREPGYEPKNLAASARNLSLGHPWWGNVREMLNTLRRAAVWTPGPLGIESTTSNTYAQLYVSHVRFRLSRSG
jgi:transcriptional regulator with GAF, ATPase, and Fis domain